MKKWISADYFFTLLLTLATLAACIIATRTFSPARLEPSSTMLILSGVAGVVAMRRRQ